MSRTRAILKRLLGEERATTAVEFALLLPVFAMMLMGIFDMAYNMYSASIVQGAIHEAARDSSIEGALPADVDNAVRNAVYNVAPNATVAISRRSYTNVADVNKPEDYDDANGNGSCDNGELFQDANSNAKWDADMGKSGQGEARDAVLYTVRATYPRAFPIAEFIGMGSKVVINSTTVLRNQPFGQQLVSNATGNCT